MDNGEVIAGLNEGWTFMGANLGEWIAGMIITMIFGSVSKLPVVNAFPLYAGCFLGVTVGLAFLRGKHAEGTAGVAKAFATFLGIAPPGIPRPSSLQPLWSGAPVKKLKEDSDYQYLDLDDMFIELYQERYGEED